VSAADALLVVHFAIVVFIVGGLILTWAGALLGWAWVRNPWFRYAHLGAIAFVALEALVGMMCPLTLWEDALRGGSRPDSFIGRWVQRLLYYRAPEWVFTTLYVAWATATALTLWLVPPRANRSRLAK
jgi:polyferredoxin